MNFTSLFHKNSHTDTPKKSRSSNQKWYQKRTNQWLMGMIATLVLMIVFVFAYGSRNWDWMASLTANYTDPTKTFKVYFPGKKPILVDGSFMDYPIINYYVIDQKNNDEYRVSYITDVNSLLGVSGTDLIKNTGKAVITELADTGSDMNRELIMLKNETEGDLQVMEAQVLDKNDTQYQLYKIIGRGNEIFIIRTTGSSQRLSSYQRFIKSFTLLNRSKQNLNVDLTEEMVESIPVVVDQSSSKTTETEKTSEEGKI